MTWHGVRGSTCSPRRSRHSWRSPKHTAAAALSSLALLVTTAASAQTPQELEKARTLFREGVALSAANNWAGACAKFKAVAQVKMNAQVAFNIAECEEKLGKLVSALGNYRLAKSSAAESNAKDVSSQVDGRITSLEERIPKLTIKRGANAEAASIELDGTEIGAAQIGTAIPVDPGPHVVVGKTGEKEGSRQTITLAEKESKTATVAMKATAPVEPTTEPKPPIDEPKPDQPAPSTGGSKVPGAIVTAVGGASIVAGVVFLVLRQGTISDLETACGGDNSCPPSAESTADDGKLYTGLAEVTIGLGVIGVATGIVLLVTSGPSAPAAPAPEARRVRFVGAAPGASLGGVSLRGSF